MAARPETIDEYLAAFSEEQRAALQKLRKTIQAAAPMAEECINSDGLSSFEPEARVFRLIGRFIFERVLSGNTLVGFGASAKHCSFY